MAAVLKAFVPVPPGAAFFFFFLFFLQGFHSSCSLNSNQIQGKQAWDDWRQLEDKQCGADAGSDGGLDCGSLILRMAS